MIVEYQGVYGAVVGLILEGYQFISPPIEFFEFLGLLRNERTSPS
jgi:hypothetical protein